MFIADDAPATIGLIIDGSGSMLGKREAVVQAALAFARAGNASDELFLVMFNDVATLGLPPSLPFTSDLDILREALSRQVPAGRPPCTTPWRWASSTSRQARAIERLSCS